MSFGNFLFLTAMAMAFAFNLYLADVIVRLRQDVQEIRKQLGIAHVTTFSAKDRQPRSETDPNTNTNKNTDTDTDERTPGANETTREMDKK